MITDKNLKSGFYWVKVDGCSEWEIALWDSTSAAWDFCNDRAYADGMDLIDELSACIEPPKA